MTDHEVVELMTRAKRKLSEAKALYDDALISYHRKLASTQSACQHSKTKSASDKGGKACVLCEKEMS